MTIIRGPSRLMVSIVDILGIPRTCRNHAGEHVCRFDHIHYTHEAWAKRVESRVELA